MHDYPHLNSKGNFPDVDGVNAYKYDNQLDYKRYDYSQMEIQVCSVPWDMGEAHVGNRTIEGVGNVVKFADKSARDAWFDAIPDSECFRWETKYKDLHQGKHGDTNSYGEIRVPLPFDIAARYNYVRVKYHLFANDSSPLEYESGDGVQEWFYFIRQVNFIAPNTTELSLMDDAWQDWIYDCDITGMMLERGHAPMFHTTVQQYLSMPINNNSDLLTEDVTFGEFAQVKYENAVTLNGKGTVVCIVTTSQPWTVWGTKADKDMTTPAANHTSTSGVPSYRVFCMPVSQFDGFLDNISENIPQFKQTVKAVFFIEEKYISTSTNFSFGGADCSWVTGSSGFNTSDLLKLGPENFMFPDNYARIAKLYTWPYSAIELTDEKGNADYVRIEDTTGTLTLSVAANITFPYLNLTGNINGIGHGSGERYTITYQNLTTRTMATEGRWFEHVKNWDIPCFAVILEAKQEREYSAFYDNIQREYEYKTNRAIDHDVYQLEYLNSTANNDLEYGNVEEHHGNAKRRNNLEYGDIASGQGNAKRRNDRIQNNEFNIAEAQHYNERQQTSFLDKVNKSGGYQDDYLDNTRAAMNDLVNAQRDAANTKASDDVGTTVSLNSDLAAVDNESLAATTVIGGASSIVGGIAQGAVTGAIAGGGAGAALGAGVGAIGGLVSAGSATASYPIVAGKNNAVSSLSSTAAQALEGHVETYNKATASATRTYNTDSNKYHKTLLHSTNTAQTTMLDNQADKMYGALASTRDASGTVKWNASKTKEVNDTIADNTHAVQNTVINNTHYIMATNNARRYHYMYTGEDMPKNDEGEQRYSVSQYRRDIAKNKIDNDNKQAALRAPFEFGSIDNATSSTTRPLALYATVVTQSDSAIAKAGDIMLRYGYMYDGYWAFDGNWVLGKYYTYWKVSDFWIKNNNIADMYMDRIRFFLFGGVTVWNKPEDIGNVSIYDNWK